MKKKDLQKRIRDLENQNLILMFERDIANRSLESCERVLEIRNKELDKAYQKIGELVMDYE